MKRAISTGVFALAAVLALAAQAPPPVRYELRFPQPEHHWMEVEAVFPAIGGVPLQLRMSRTSPGRYALHEFAKNVFDVRITDGSGRLIGATRPNPHQWDVIGHDGTVRVVYKVFGDRVDGTYLGIDSTHAHINMPAALMWARGFEERPVRLRLVQPPRKKWQAATQLHPAGDDTFTAATLQFLMDSPIEFGAFTLKSFTTPPPDGGAAASFRIALHHLGTEAEAARFASDVEKIVREAAAIYGEFPRYDSGMYTFLADYLPWASGDGMEHRNSTVLTSSRALASDREELLGTVAHEFFHCWNVERIRPRSLEPFNFEDANMSGELWLAEGFTSYYDGLLMSRTGLSTLETTLNGFAGLVNVVGQSPGRRLRTAEEMSLLAPFVDGGRSADRTNWENTFISYYTWGAAIALGLDLTLRDRSDGRVTLDDYMRAMWQQFGKPGGRLEGYVDRPYTMEDASEVLGRVSGDRAFGDEFFRRYIQGREVVDYERLLARAGLVLRHVRADRASMGAVRLDGSGGRLRVVGAVPMGSPAYAAGIEIEDVILSLDGKAIASREQVDEILGAHRPGDRVAVVFTRRGGEQVTATLELAGDPSIEIVPIEQTGQPLGDKERAVRRAWLESRGK